VKGLAIFWPFFIECLPFFTNFVGRFGLFLLKLWPFFEKTNLETLLGTRMRTAQRLESHRKMVTLP